MTRIYLTVLVLLLAAFARLWHFGDAPPGLQHDEIFKAIEGVRVVEDGDIHLFYSSNQGHEGGYVWFIGLAYALIGDSVMMIKFPAFVFGMLTIALLYRVAADLYGHRVGIIVAGLAAVSFWTVFTSRVGLRAVSLPVIILLVIWGLIRLSRQPGWTLAVATGVALGFAIYTYTSSIALYPAFAVYVVALAVFQRTAFRRQWRYLAATTVIGVLLTLPMIAIRMDDDIGSNRINSISRPWIEFQNGNPDELIDNAWKLAGMPVFTGDPEWRYNIAERPLFPVLPGLLVYVGVLILVWRMRHQPMNSMLLMLLLAGLIPSLLTVSAPSYLRSIITLPTIMIGIALAVDAIPDKRIAWGLGIAMIGITTAADFPAYFDRWANHDAVFAIYRDDLEQLAHTLRENNPDLALVSVDDAELDPLIFYSYATPETDMVFFDGLTNIVLRHEPTLLFVSPFSPITPPHADWLNAEVLPPLLRQDGEIAFHVYRVGGPALQERIDKFSQEPVYTGQPTAFVEAEPLAFPVNFGNIIQLVAVDVPRLEIARENDGVNIQLYLEPIQGRLDLPLNIYVHLLDAQGQVVAQRDLLGVRPNMWDTRTVFMQDNYVIGGSLKPGRYILSMGVYNWDTMERLPVIGRDADQILISEIEVR